jgi:hypothetical protein
MLRNCIIEEEDIVEPLQEMMEKRSRRGGDYNGGCNFQASPK